MSAGIDFEHGCPPAVRIGPKETGPIDAGSVWRPVWSVEGWWSNVNIFLDCPASWAAPLTNVSVRLYALTSAGRDLVAQTTITASGMEILPDGSRRGIVLKARGYPGSGWLVEALNPSAIMVPPMSVPSAIIIGELWGTESTPEGIGRRPRFNIDDRTIPSRASQLMGWPGPIVAPDLPVNQWMPVALNPLNGHLIVDAAIVVPPVVIGEQSRFNQFGTLADALVKGSAGRVFSATAENVTGPQKFFQLHNKLGALVLGDVPAISLAVPTNSTVVIGNDFFGPPFAFSPLLGGLFFGAAIRWGWSTTRATYTAAPAATQQTQILFA